MKIYKILILILFCKTIPYLLIGRLDANQITIDMTGKAEFSGLSFKDKSRYRLFKSNGYWKSSKGDYGLHECFGTLKNNKNNDASFNVFCKNTSQNNEYFILKIYRGTKYEDSGAGKATIIETSEVYEYLLSAECDHAITYIKENYFAMQKCRY